jgi:DNA-binding transcriptional ArsR family regulator
MSGGRGKPRDEQHLDRVFHCLSDPARRKILALLREAGELSVGDVGKAFSMTQNGVSKHLKVLEGAGLVRRRVDGRVHWISVNWEALSPAYSWLHFHRHFWDERLEAFVDYAARGGLARKEKS